MTDLVCTLHGPYDASYGSCPYCAAPSRRPPSPPSLDDNMATDRGGSVSNLATDLGGGGNVVGSINDLPTDLGNSPAPAGFQARNANIHDMPTDLGNAPVMPERPRPAMRSHSGRDDDATSLGHNQPRDDVTEIDQAPLVGMLGILWCKQGTRRGSIYKIQNGMVVGRKEGGLNLDDPKVSNPHAKFTVEQKQFIVWDFGSTNGTYVNGERIRGATVLKENDEIKFGDNFFILKTME
jgi:hypothetical protein